ncbi:YndM family protein [Litchfieldia salsa]|uniref:DUF2512 family protein n=1 Tax=Litchfieldia salsa TaxID=930152 RepID=A0A1H0WP78_9BACI|nr:YndM family protein [Litchfieldia salsa]SDP92463.1 Protein of unknown function [Litchfieldia salsa]
MKHLVALGIKFGVISIVLLSVLSIFTYATISGILVISLLVTGVSYVLGDLFILPRFGNLVATIADFGLAFLSVWFLSSFFIEATFPIITASFFIAIFITLTEALFHVYMKSRVFNSEESSQQQGRQTNEFGNYQTEFAEEENPQSTVKSMEQYKENKRKK